jgi:hypothetical protein
LEIDSANKKFNLSVHVRQKNVWQEKKDTGTSKADNQSAIACHQLAQVKNFRLSVALANIISIMQINIYR